MGILFFWQISTIISIKDSCEKESVNGLPKVVGFHRVLRFLAYGKLTGWVRINTIKK
jgi:hypothetical protein